MLSPVGSQTVNTPTLDRFLNEDEQSHVQVVGRNGRKHATLNVDGTVLAESNSDDFGSVLELLELSAARLLGNGNT